MQRTTVTWLVVGGIGWAGLALIALQLAQGSGAGVGFDLEILLQGGRDVAAGRTPYDPALLSGTAPVSTSLFYSYPPPIAQVLAPFAAVSSMTMLLAWWAGAMTGLLVVAEALRRHLAPTRPSRDVLLAVAAVAPLVLPFTVGLLFGNFDVWFPLLYGAMLLAAVVPSRPTAVTGGFALVLASLKLHPASMGLWFLVRAIRERRGAPGTERAGRSLEVVGAAGVAGLAVIVLSVAVGGLGPWTDYLLVVQTGASADIVDPRNAGLAATATALIGGDQALARMLHVFVGLATVLVTAWAAWCRPDPLESFAWAASASLATLPVTWYHYPSALIPVALAVVLRAPTSGRGRVRMLVVAAGVTAALALTVLPLLWVAAGLIIAAARVSRPDPADRAGG